jgi:3-dehydro-L-gulonate 2-dehydrogenase
MRIPYERMIAEFRRVLLATGFVPERAERAAHIFADASRDGVYTHGLDRFPHFVADVKKGTIERDAAPERLAAIGCFERWDGRNGVGPLNAWHCMERAIALAREHAVGCVALRRTNHWMRAGTYGLEAADAGCIGICWTNTVNNLPPWGGITPRVGNNPLVITVPRPGGAHVALDMAMTQFSYGKMATHRRHGEPLPVDGGYDAEGRPTRDAAAILASGRPLPAGLWKGSGLSLALDLVAALLSEGNTTGDIAAYQGDRLVSQVFLAIDLARVTDAGFAKRATQVALDYFHDSEPLEPGRPPLYPGERMFATRAESMREGVLVEEKFWQAVVDL